MILSIFFYLEEIVYRVTPKKTLYIALDGVAPRAKIDQQRQRRYPTYIDEDKEEQVVFDSRSVTPGTDFMTKISVHMNYLIRRKVQDDPKWQKCERIIFSDGSVPGEGEHKIMDYIRKESLTNEQFVQTETHCMYGMDSDLIMLALATHLPRIYILRDWVANFSDYNARYHWSLKRKKGKKKHPQEEFEHRFHILDIGLLRDFIYTTFSSLRDQLKSENFLFNLERVIDDFILMLFLCGNDFLPSIPTLDIGQEEKALNYFFDMYKQSLPSLGGYITDTRGSKLINIERLKLFMTKVANIENIILNHRLKREPWFKRQQRVQSRESTTHNVPSAPSVAPVTAPAPTSASTSSVQLLKSVISPDNYQNLLSSIDIGNSECLNSKSDLNRFLMLSSVAANNFTSKYEFTSNIDQQLLLKLSFKQPLNLCSVLLRGKDLSSGPGIVKLFTNNRTLDFTNVDDVPCAQEINVYELATKANGSYIEVPLKLAKFQNVYHLSIYVSNNGSAITGEEQPKTIVTGCVLFGIPSKTAYNATPSFNKIKKNKGWRDQYNKVRNYMGYHNRNKGYENRPQPTPQQQEHYEKQLKKTEEAHEEDMCVLPHAVDNDKIDLVKYKEAYYGIKMGIEHEEEKNDVVIKYIEGLYWVFYYYFRGLVSWSWHYPYHYAPLASDIVNSDTTKLFPNGITFHMDRPLRPFEQLLTVLPPHHVPSKHLMPVSYQALANKIINGDTEISMFYPHPNTVKIDPGEEGFKRSENKQPRNKRKFHYARMIMLLPFIDHSMVSEVIAKEVDEQALSSDEIERNKIGSVKTFKYNKEYDGGVYNSTLPVLPDVDHVKCQLVQDELFDAGLNDTIVPI
jgi:5'-3' exonuclease